MHFFQKIKKLGKTKVSGRTEKILYALLSIMTFLSVIIYVLISSTYLENLVNFVYYPETSFILSSTIIETLVFLFLAISCIFIFLKLLTKTHERFIILKNNYLILSLILIVFILIFGLSAIRIFYIQQFPLKFDIIHPERKIYGNITCGSSFHNLDPVEDDKFQCLVKFSNLEKRNYNITNIIVIDYKYNTDESSRPKILFTPFVINSSTTVYFAFLFPVGNLGRNYFYTYVYLQSVENENLPDTPILRSNKLVFYKTFSTSEYSNLQDKRISSLFLLISVGVFSVFVGVNNLKNILSSSSK